MIDRELNRQLDRVAGRLRTYRFWSGMGIVWILAAVLVGTVSLTSGPSTEIDGVMRLVFLLGLIGSVLVIVFSFRSGRDVHRLAQQIEAHFPQLNSTLLTAVEQHPDLATGQMGYLQQSVVDKAMHHALIHDWQNLISRGRMGFARLSAFLGILLLLSWSFAFYAHEQMLAENETNPELAFDEVVLSGAQYEATIEPGDAEVERGASLLVLARFADRLPPDATLLYTSADGEEHSVSMSRSLDDPLFGGRIASVSEPLSYRVQFGEQVTQDYRVIVFEYPRLLQTDARLVFPSYTNQEEKFLQDVRRVSAVEGTRLTILCRVNKPLAAARFVEETDEGEETISLEQDASDPLTYAVTLLVDRSRELALHLTDDEGRTNRHPTQFRINVIVNRPPDIKLAQPTHDLEVSPIEEVDLAASAWDDFGLQRVGVSYMIPGKLDREVSLGETFPSKERFETEYLLALEELHAEPDQLVSWYFWAEDIGPDGQVRRTSSDMFFAEVRPFEEIFRQGQQPTNDQQQQQQQQQQQGSQNAQQAQQLAELQKQIINATWKVIRRETRDEPTSQFESDVRLIIESQQAALEQLGELQENLQDTQSLEYAELVKLEMQDALLALESAANGPSIPDLQPALGREQAAYQGLLRLRAREHEVVRANQSQQQQSQQSQQSQNSRSQQQLQQLQLREDENRYAQEQQAQTEQEQQAREDRQVLNRLRELAQRQNDLNERIKELQAALEAAETEEERAEAERQLKRLREEQEEILRDTEELQQRMEEPENQERMAEQRQQLEEARENIRQSSEALQQQMVTQAANEGTRAERGLEELKEEFQQRTSGQFEEAMREMRRQAQELTQEEQKLAEQLENLRDGKGENANSLRESGEREQTERQLAEQRERLDQLLENMRETIEQAEDTQPLLAERLYDTIRETRKNDPQKALESTDMLLRRGFLDDAADQEEQASEGIGQLAEGVEQAAEQVLGDETETLRRALNELERLNEVLEGEIARAEGREPNPRTGQTPGEENDENAQRNPDGSPRQTDQPGEIPGEQPPREGQQNGNQQPGQRQPGQQQQGQQPGQQPQNQPQPGNESGQSNEQQPGQQQPGQPQNQPGQQPQPGQPQEGQQSGQQPGQPQNQPGQQPGQPQNQPGQPPQQGRQPGQPQEGQQPGQRDTNRRLTDFGGNLDRFSDNGGFQPASPFSGDNDFVEWSDRLRDVEEIVEDPELRAEAARIREEARELRKEILGTSAPPQWDIIKEKVARPLTELQSRVAEELLKRTSEDARVPIDKDPVPTQYEQAVRRYYERLGSGK